MLSVYDKCKICFGIFGLEYPDFGVGKGKFDSLHLLKIIQASFNKSYIYKSVVLKLAFY